MLGEVRVAVDLPLVCPAALPIGEKLAGSGCRCRVTDTDVLSGTDPSSLKKFCTARSLTPVEIGDEVVVGGYDTCPAYRKDREHQWETRSNRDMFARA
jgi:hypothetical protein